MKIKYLTYGVFLILLQSCAVPVVKNCSYQMFDMLSMKKAIDKNEDEISAYLEKNKMDFYDYSFVMPKISIDSLSAKKHALDIRKYERGVGQSPTQMRVYNSSGNLINGYLQCYGHMSMANILSEKETTTFASFPNNFSLLFEDELSLLDISEETKEEIILKQPQKTYTFVIYWNIWSNNFSRIMFKKLKQYLKKFDMRDHVLIMLINTDNMTKPEAADVDQEK